MDHVVVCAGQVSENILAQELEAQKVPCHLIGGAKTAAELDAKKAIYDGTTVAMRV